MSMDAAGGTQSRRRAELLVIPDITGRCRMAGKRTPHPPLRPVRRNSSSRTTSSAPAKRSPRRTRPSLRARGRQPGRRHLACAALPLLRRPDDHRRDVRRPAPFAFPVAEPDQDRQLMTVAPLPASQRRSPPPPAARRNRKATPSRGRQSSSERRAHARPAHRRHRKRQRRRSRQERCAPPAPEAARQAPSATPKSP